MSVVTIKLRGAPFAGPIRAASHSADELRDCMRILAVQHEVEPLQTQLDGVATGVIVGGVQVAFVRYGAPTRVVTEATGDTICWTVPIGPMGVAFGLSGPDVLGDGFVLARDSQTTMFPSPDRGAVVLTTTETLLDRHLAALTGRATRGRLSVAPGPSRSATRGLVDSAWKHVARVLGATPSLLPLVQGSLEELLLTSMLLELPSNAAEELYSPQTSRYSGEAHARRSVDWATDHITEPITMTSWAAGVGLSVRHLQKVFREVHSCTPGHYLLGLRLDRAHQLLQRATPNRTVTAIATETGFGHMGRFASAYRERFGAQPSATLRRAG